VGFGGSTTEKEWKGDAGVNHSVTKSWSKARCETRKEKDPPSVTNPDERGVVKKSRAQEKERLSVKYNNIRQRGGRGPKV